MSGTLLNEIEAAEQSAKEIQANAAREAREIIKGAEEAIAAGNRQTAHDVRDSVAQITEETVTAANGEIAQLAEKRAAEREKIKQVARLRIDQAGSAIFERIVADGDR